MSNVERKPVKALYPEGKYQAVVLDTINALQNNLYLDMMRGKKGSHDEWKDFGVEILALYDWIKSLPDTIMVQILGVEGTGKTVGASTLDPTTTQYINADKKPLSFFGARKKYRDKITPEQKEQGLNVNLRTPSTYEEVQNIIQSTWERRRGTLVVFVLGHIEHFNMSSGGVGQRLKVLGKQATKLGIEGLNTVHTYYTKIDVSFMPNDPQRYKLNPFNTGFNTARSPQGFWEGEIPNDYQLILERILEDTGEIEI